MYFFSRYKYLLMIPILILSCAEDLNNKDIIQFEYETACGWCAGSALLVISKTKTDYTRNIPCGENKGMKNYNSLLKANEWEKLMNCYDHGQFQKLIINLCGVCFDGCDERIKIIRNGTEHEIKYLPSDIPEEVDSLRNILQKIILEFEGK